MGYEETAETYVLDAYIRLSFNKLNEAKYLIKCALDLEPDSPDIWILYAKYQIKLAHTTEKIEEIKKAAFCCNRALSSSKNAENELEIIRKVKVLLEDINAYKNKLSTGL